MRPVAALRIRPKFAEAHNNLGNAFVEQRDIDQAIDAYRVAIGIDREFASAHYNLSFVLLLKGQFAEGWDEYEWRTRTPGEEKPASFQQPRWDGRPLAGQTVLLHAEQGCGDTIQMLRYAPLVAGRGGRVVLACPPELVRLAKTATGIEQVVAAGQNLPAFDAHCPLMSLGHLFETRLDTILSNVPYLKPEPEFVAQWEQRLGPHDGRMRVGLVWAGNPKFKFDRTRSVELNMLAPLAEARNVVFYSLQKGQAAEQAKTPPPGLNLNDLSREIHDFVDTAALLSQLDLLITTDTSVPHLAGGWPGRLWLMLQFVPDWRWLLDRQDSPWYPTMRLFRQRFAGDWRHVVESVAEA